MQLPYKDFELQYTCTSLQSIRTLGLKFKPYKTLFITDVATQQIANIQSQTRPMFKKKKNS